MERPGDSSPSSPLCWPQRTACCLCILLSRRRDREPRTPLAASPSMATDNAAAAAVSTAAPSTPHADTHPPAVIHGQRGTDPGTALDHRNQRPTLRFGPLTPTDHSTRNPIVRFKWRREMAQEREDRSAPRLAQDGSHSAGQPRKSSARLQPTLLLLLPPPLSPPPECAVLPRSPPPALPPCSSSALALRPGRPTSLLPDTIRRPAHLRAINAQHRL